MRCTVVWTPFATDRLADIWLTASDPTAVTSAANQLDLLLRTSPQTGDESAGVQQLRVGILHVAYTYSADDCLVTVVDVDIAA